MADLRRAAAWDTVGAYGTPTVVHLGSALLVSAIFSAPWSSLDSASIALGLTGLAGLGYSLVAIYRARHQTSYQPEMEDWIWFSILPCIPYTIMAVSALFLNGDSDTPYFAIAAAALSLLFIGIHNAWDAVTFIAVTNAQDDSAKSE
jgi:hypothetical protein